MKIVNIDLLGEFAKDINKPVSQFNKDDWLKWYRLGEWRIGELKDELKEMERLEHYIRCAAIKIIINEFYYPF